MNPDVEIQGLLSGKGMQKAPDELLLRVETAAASRLHFRRRMQASFAMALAACLVMAVLLLPLGKRGREDLSARNATFIDGIFGTFTASEVQSDSTYSLLSMDDDDFPAVCGQDQDTLDVTLVDF